MRAGTAWRSRLYWSNIACDGASVVAVRDGEGVEWSSTGLMEKASLVGELGGSSLHQGQELAMEAVVSALG